MPTNLYGSYLATNTGNQTSRPYDISDQIMVLSEFKPLFSALALQNFTPTHNERFQWDEIDLTADHTQINATAGYNTAATAFVVDDATIFVINDLVYNVRTMEVYQITNINYGTNTITVLRDIGTANLAALNDNDVLYKIGTAFPESSTSPDESISNSATVYNYCQIFRKTFSISGTKDRTLSSPGMDAQSLSARMALEFTREIEFNMLFGRRSEDTSNFSKVRHTTGGFQSFVSTNVSNINGTLSETVFDDFLLDKVFSKGNLENKIMICGDNFFRCFTKWGKSYLTLPESVDTLGVAIQRLTCPTGQGLAVYNHPLFKGNTTLAGLGFVIDTTRVGARYTQNPSNTAKNGRLQYIEGTQAPGTDGTRNEYFAEIGLEVRDESAHAIIKNVTGPA